MSCSIDELPTSKAKAEVMFPTEVPPPSNIDAIAFTEDTAPALRQVVRRIRHFRLLLSAVVLDTISPRSF
jgi:hypothetical protein